MTYLNTNARRTHLLTHAKKTERKTRISHLLHTRNIPQTQRQTVPKSKGCGKGTKKQAGVAILLPNISCLNKKSEELEENTAH